MEKLCDSIVHRVLLFTGFELGLRGVGRRFNYLHDMAYPSPPTESLDHFVARITAQLCEAGCLKRDAVPRAHDTKELYTYSMCDFKDAVKYALLRHQYMFHSYTKDLIDDGGAYTRALYNLLIGFFQTSKSSMTSLSSSNASSDVSPFLYHKGVARYTVLLNQRYLIKQYFCSGPNRDVGIPDSIPADLLWKMRKGGGPTDISDIDGDIRRMGDHEERATKRRRTGLSTENRNAVRSCFVLMYYIIDALAPSGSRLIPYPWILAGEKHLIETLGVARCGNCLHLAGDNCQVLYVDHYVCGACWANARASVPP